MIEVGQFVPGCKNLSSLVELCSQECSVQKKRMKG